MFRVLKNKKGVTLVELLAVVVILGIIAAIAVPTIGGLINRQKERAAEATYDAIVEAAKLYASAKDDNQFLLSELTGTAGYLDLKDNVVSSTEDGAAEDIWITVTGTVVTFNAAGATPGALLTELYINGLPVLG